MGNALKTNLVYNVGTGHRSVFSFALVIAIALALWLSPFNRASESSAQALPVSQNSKPVRPNVLFIAIDDLNDYISPLDHHPGVKTPNFERLAGRSVTFLNAHCAAPACHPSRVAVMTGVHPIRSGIYLNMFGARGPRWRHESPVLADAIVLSQHFRDHGYRAVGGGKIFHTLQWTAGDSQNDPDAWDAYRGDPLDPISADWPRPELVADDTSGIGPGRPLGKGQLFGASPLLVPNEQTGDHRVVDWAIEQMSLNRDEPLFLAVGLFRPHIPWEVPQEWFDLYPIEDVQLPHYLEDDLDDAHSHGREAWHKWVVENDQWRHLMQGYLASTSYVDHQLGRLLDALDESPRSDNTIVVLWSDHGFHIGEKENWEKFALWDQTTRVPLFIDAPGISQEGTATIQPATLTDLYPTLCELAGLPIPDQCDGVSLLPQLRNPATARATPALTSFQFSGEATPSHGIRDERYRYIEYGDGSAELYDLCEDENEFTNIVKDPANADVVARLSAAIPNSVAPNRTIPRDSPYHRNRRDRIQPSIAGKALRISLRVESEGDAPDGVLLSQGGDHHGFSIYLQEGRLHFAVRRHQQLTLLSSQEQVPTGAFSIEASLMNDRLTLWINGEEVATGKSPGLLDVEPNEGRTVQADPQTAVGDYLPPYRFEGKVRNVKIE